MVAVGGGLEDKIPLKLSNTLKELLRDKCIESNGATEEKMVILTKNRKKEVVIIFWKILPPKSL